MRNNKILLAVALAFAIVVTNVTYALLTTTVHVPVTWIINHNVNVAVTINGTLWINGSTLQWGLVSPSSVNMLDLTVENLGSKPCTVFITTVNVPAGYTLTWSSSGTVMPIGGTVSGDLTLTVPVTTINNGCTFYVVAEEVE